MSRCAYSDCPWRRPPLHSARSATGAKSRRAAGGALRPVPLGIKRGKGKRCVSPKIGTPGKGTTASWSNSAGNSRNLPEAPRMPRPFKRPWQELRAVCLCRHGVGSGHKRPEVLGWARRWTDRLDVWRKVAYIEPEILKMGKAKIRQLPGPVGTETEGIPPQP